jgi:hypothetical protein
MPQSDEQIFRVLPRQVDLPISTALRQWLPDLSWSQVRRLVENRRVMVSGNLCVDPARRLTLRDVVKLLANPWPRPPTKRRSGSATSTNTWWSWRSRPA